MADEASNLILSSLEHLPERISRALASGPLGQVLSRLEPLGERGAWTGGGEQPRGPGGRFAPKGGGLDSEKAEKTPEIYPAGMRLLRATGFGEIAAKIAQVKEVYDAIQGFIAAVKPPEAPKAKPPAPAAPPKPMGHEAMAKLAESAPLPVAPPFVPPVPPAPPPSAAPSAAGKPPPSTVPPVPAPVATAAPREIPGRQKAFEGSLEELFGKGKLTTLPPATAAPAAAKAAPAPEAKPGDWFGKPAAPTATAAPPPPATKSEFIDARAEIEKMGGEAVKAAEKIVARVMAHLQAGGKVTAHTEGKQIPIVSVNSGMMQDAKGHKWGTQAMAMQVPGNKGGVELHPIEKPVRPSVAAPVPSAAPPAAKLLPTPPAPAAPPSPVPPRPSVLMERAARRQQDPDTQEQRLFRHVSRGDPLRTQAPPSPLHERSAAKQTPSSAGVSQTAMPPTVASGGMEGEEGVIGRKLLGAIEDLTKEIQGMQKEGKHERPNKPDMGRSQGSRHEVVAAVAGGAAKESPEKEAMIGVAREAIKIVAAFG
jgi:hypothetical protein